MASFVKINDFVLDVAEGEHQLDSDQLIVALSNTAPAGEASNPTGDGNGILGNVTEVSYTNLSTRNITTTSSAQSGGTYKLTLTDLVLTASGNVATFRYVYIYNSAAAVKTNPLIATFDNGSTVTMTNGDTFTLDFDGSGGFLTIA